MARVNAKIRTTDSDIIITQETCKLKISKDTADPVYRDLCEAFTEFLETHHDYCSNHLTLLSSDSDQILNVSGFTFTFYDLDDQLTAIMSEIGERGHEDNTYGSLLKAYFEKNAFLNPTEIILEFCRLMSMYGVTTIPTADIQKILNTPVAAKPQPSAAKKSSVSDVLNALSSAWNDGILPAATTLSAAGHEAANKARAVKAHLKKQRDTL